MNLDLVIDSRGPGWTIMRLSENTDPIFTTLDYGAGPFRFMVMPGIEIGGMTVEFDGNMPVYVMEWESMTGLTGLHGVLVTGRQRFECLKRLNKGTREG